MAIFNEILTARFARFAQKLFSMKGAAPIRALGGELTTVMPLFNGAENRYLEGWERFGNNVQQAAVAAQNSRFRLRNPTSSNVLCVLELITAANLTAADVVAMQNSIVNTADLGTIDSAAQLDSRTRANSSTICSHGSAAADMTTARAIGGKFAPINTAVDLVLFEDQEITLLPGMSVEIKTGAVNETLNCSYIFRERPLEPSETT